MNRRGLTLVEVVLSIAIAAIVMALLFAALRLGQKSGTRGEKKLELSQREMVVADRLSWLLAGAYPLIIADDADEEEVLAFVGQGDSIEFVTTSVDTYSNTEADLAGLKSVRIHLDDGGLKVGERIFFMRDDEFVDYVLEPNARSVEFEYMEIDEETGEALWVSGWDTEESMYIPAAVKVRVMLVVEGREQVIPEIIVRIPTGGPTGIPVPALRLP